MIYCLIDYKRKYLKHLEYENIDDLNICVEDRIYENITVNELEEETQTLINCLKEEDRNLFMKLYVEEKDIEVVSKETGMNREVIYFGSFWNKCWKSSFSYYKHYKF